jgi:hypothetical protein
VLAAPIIYFAGDVCEPAPQGRCAVGVSHSSVPGADSYVMVSAAEVEVPCTALAFRNSCVGVFPSAPGCTVLKAVDAAGNRGLPSTEFCVPRTAS